MPKYHARLKFDVEGDPPSVYIVDKDGLEYLEIFDEARLKTNEFSWNSEDWALGHMTRKILYLLNAAEDFEM